MDIKQVLTEYYQSYDEDGRLLSRHGIPEFAATMKYIEGYLTPEAKIIEIGAGTGRYSHALAERGYAVDAVELVEHNIEIFKSKITPNERITVRQGNAIDLSAFEDNTYDITLLLGPMYHLFTDEDQMKALSEAYRVTKSGGVIFVAYCMGDATMLTYGFMRGQLQSMIADCKLDTDSFDTYREPWGIFKLMRTEDIKALREPFDIEPLHLIATDGYSNHMRDTLAQMDEETFGVYLKYHLATCEREDMLGISHHTLDIYRKR